jgi:hypothetical protein
VGRESYVLRQGGAVRSSTSNIFHTTLAVHLSSLTAGRRSMRVSNKGVASQRCSTTSSQYGTRGMEAAAGVVVSSELWRVSLGGNP